MPVEKKFGFFSCGSGVVWKELKGDIAGRRDSLAAEKYLGCPASLLATVAKGP